MFFAPGESFFGVGPAEAAVVMAVGYFVLGPTELYKLTKAIGQVVGQFKDFGIGTVINLQDIMEKEVMQAEEKARGGRGSLDRLWGNAGSNSPSEPPVDGEDEYEDIYEDGELAAPAEAGKPAEKPEFSPAVSAAQEARRRRATELLADDGFSPVADDDEYEELDVDEFLAGSAPSTGFEFRNKRLAERAASAAGTDESSSSSDAKKGAIGAPPASKFAAQMSGDWNQKVLEEEAKTAGGTSPMVHDVPQDLTAADKADDLEPLALTMDEQFARLERLAELEEERAALMQRLDAEFEKKMRAMRGELMDLVDQDYRARRDTLNADAKARRNKV